MNFKRNLLSDAVRLGLVAGVAGVLGVNPAPVFAQDDSAELDRIEVTGSRIKRVDIEGPNPITVITRADLEVTGDISVADVLRSTTFNTFGSFRESSGNTAQSQATISLRGVGSNRTLILLDGRRLPGSPVLGMASQNLNIIPFAAVERIEILRDGASAVYGSDAIGGVINIILRKDYEGLQFSAQYERPTAGEPIANNGSIVGGISSARGNTTFVLDHQEREIFFNRDRPTGIPGLDPAVGLSAFGFPGSAYLYGSTDGTFSGPFLGLFPDPRCPATIGSSAQFPNSRLSPAGNICQFNYAATSANEASLRRDSLTVNSTYEISDNVQFFARATGMMTESFGRYAATPITTFPSIAGDNPNNIFGQDAFLLFRFVAGGERDSTVDEAMLDVLFGFRGNLDLFGGADWEVGFSHNRYQIKSIGTGYALGPPLQNLIDRGIFNPFGDPSDPSVAAGVLAVSHTILQDAETRFVGMDGNISFDLFQMDNGAVPLVVGFDYRDERFKEITDLQSQAGNVLGTAGGAAAGERAAYAIFAETLIPILENLNLSIAVRRDHYNDFGNSTNPKIGLEFRPLDNLLLRAGWGEGFRAPSLVQLNAAPRQSFPAVIDRLNCDLGTVGLPFDPCTQNQVEVSFLSNPNLTAETSTNWGAGVVWNPIDNLTLSLDYYDIELEGQISSFPLQLGLNNEAAGIANPPGFTIIRNPNNNRIALVLIPNFNLGGFQTSGFDFEIDYRHDTDFGTFNPSLEITRVRGFKTRILPTSPFTSGDLGLATPDTRANFVLNWRMGDFSAGINGNYIGDSQSLVSTARIPSWTTWNLQGSWNAPWNGRLTLGVRNIGDRAPPLSAQAFAHPFYDNEQYNFYGRVPYVRYEQNF